jgi:hypothetical protein
LASLFTEPLVDAPVFDCTDPLAAGGVALLALEPEVDGVVVELVVESAGLVVVAPVDDDVLGAAPAPLVVPAPVLELTPESAGLVVAALPLVVAPVLDCGVVGVD